MKAADGQYVTPTWAFLNGKAGGVDWNHFRQWGGFSAEGFHSVLIFPEFAEAPRASSLTLEVQQWAKVTREAGLIQGASSPGSLSPLALPWDPNYAWEPMPEAILMRNPKTHTWLGRSLTFTGMRVSIGRIEVDGLIRLQEGEHDLVARPDGDHGPRHHQPEGPPPFIRANLAFGGRDPGRTWPGLELVGPGGEPLAGFGGGGGVIWSEGRVPFQRNLHGITARWGRDFLPDAFRHADRLILRYVQPEATLVIQETIRFDGWEGAPQ